jgi:putative chitinase
MKLEEKLNLILPPINGIYSHITGEFGELRPNGKTHKGIDFNYIGGQSGLNLIHPKVYSPVAGEVTFVGGNFGTIKIKDEQGFSHELLHTHKQHVQVGETIKLGEMIGTMGGKGPLGFAQYPQHVHYQIKNSIGEIENPHDFWDKHVSENNTVNSDELDAQIAAILIQDIKIKSSDKKLFQEKISLKYEDVLRGEDEELSFLAQNNSESEVQIETQDLRVDSFVVQVNLPVITESLEFV